jgi:hypothetical protein
VNDVGASCWSGRPLQREDSVKTIRIGRGAPLNSRAPQHSRLSILQLVPLFLLIVLACGICSAGTLRFYPSAKDETGTLRLAQIVHLATRDEILKLGVHTQLLLSSGVKDPDWKDGSLAVGRVNCCHQATEEGSALWFYVPPDVTLELGDIVEVRMGRESTKTDPGVINAAVRVREKQGAPDSQCSWDPPNNMMWARILYCTWMPAEGWTLKNGLKKTWLKRASNSNPQ